jgi:hypothetical protein
MDPAVHLRMLEVAAAHGSHFDSCQMPLHLMDAHLRSFAQQVIPKLVEKGIAMPGMKPMGGPQERNGHLRRVPALHAESSGFRGDHRMREHGTVRSGDGSRGQETDLADGLSSPWFNRGSVDGVGLELAGFSPHRHAATRC